ncbi:MAG: hypothetical protein ACLKAL_08065 [Alkaliphilus sp.]
MKKLMSQGVCLIFIAGTLLCISYLPFGEEDFPRVFENSVIGNSNDLETMKCDF